MKNQIVASVVLLCGLFFAACSKDDTPSLSIKETEISLNSKQEKLISVLPDASGCIFESENKLIANVSADGKVTGVTVGTTYITVTNASQKFTSKCKVTVTPLYNLFKEPYMGFGATKSTIKANESRTLAIETSTGISFTGENSNISLVMYAFDSQGKMTSAGIAFPTSKMYTTMDFLSERYIPIGYENGYGIFISNDKKMSVAITVYNVSYLMIIYTPSGLTRSSTETECKEQMIELMDKNLEQKSI